MDIDHFKKVNDEHGHLVGDRVLRAFALLLKRRLRQVDVPGRWGGEEFAIVLPSTRAADAARVMDDLRTRFAAVLHAGADRDFQVTFSVGIAELQSEDRTPQLARADRALYAAKERGRNQVVVAEAGSSRDNGPGERQQEPKR